LNNGEETEREGKRKTARKAEKNKSEHVLDKKGRRNTRKRNYGEGGTSEWVRT
jgi:hypothetical protein